MTMTVCMRLIVVLALVLFQCGLASRALACPTGVPAGLSAGTVGQGIVVDGMALSVLQVRGGAKADAVLARVEEAWRAAGYDVRRTSTAGWNVVSALSASCLATLQLLERGSAFGYLAIRPLQGKGRLAARLPVPPGATVLTTVASNDDGRKGTIAALTSRQSLEQLHGYYLRRLNDDRWNAVSSQVSVDRARTAIGAVVSARRGRERIDVVLWHDGTTHAVINLADAL